MVDDGARAARPDDEAARGLLPSGKLAIVVGIDGAGKSTVVRRLAALGYLTSHWRDLPHPDRRTAERIARAATIVSELKGPERTAFLRWLVEAEWRLAIEPQLRAGRDVIGDGFYLRPLIKEIIFGDGDVAALLAGSPLSGHELVVMIDVPVDEAVRRKGDGEISRYECFTGPDDFREFQARQRVLLLDTIRSWNHVVVDGARDVELVTSDVRQILDQHGIRPVRFT